MVRVRAKIEQCTLCGRHLVRVRVKIEKTPFVVALSSGLGHNRENTICGSLVRARAKIEKDAICGRPLVKIENETLWGGPLVRVRAKIEKKHTLW